MITLVKIFDDRDDAATEYNILLGENWIVAVSEDDQLVRVFRDGRDEPIYEESGQKLYTLIATKGKFLFRSP